MLVAYGAIKRWGAQEDGSGHWDLSVLLI